MINGNLISKINITIYKRCFMIIEVVIHEIVKRDILQKLYDNISNKS